MNELQKFIHQTNIKNFYYLFILEKYQADQSPSKNFIQLHTNETKNAVQLNWIANKLLEYQFVLCN